MTGGDLVADVLVRHGVRFLFTLCGGHISPVLRDALAVARSGRPAYVNALIGRSDFRKGSLSM